MIDHSEVSGYNRFDLKAKLAVITPSSSGFMHMRVFTHAYLCARPAIGRYPSGDGRYGFCALRARVARAIPRPQRPRPKGGKRKSPFGCGSPALQENPNVRARRVAIALNARGFGRARTKGFGRRPSGVARPMAHEKVARQRFMKVRVRYETR